MDHLSKRIKTTKESTVDDIANSVKDIASSIESISQSYGKLLRTNKLLVGYLHCIEQDQKEQSAEEIETRLAHATIEQ